MKILRYTDNGRDIDDVSYRTYEAHLDQIQDAIPAALFSILRKPTDAYESGRTFYDSVVINWQDSLSFPKSLHSTHVCIVGPYYDREFEFVFSEPVVYVNSQGRPASRIGELYCVEVSRTEDRNFVVCFVFMNRIEIEIEAQEFDFFERRIDSAAAQ